ncbi:MAG: hypothetical protein PHV33_07550 [Elusimicrobiales bacterium]|nr:hypothetical protein [Elusimicrobiales bacterium]
MEKVWPVKALKRSLHVGAVWAAFCGLLLVGLPEGPLQAEVPVKFTYQGNLRQDGFLVSGQRTMVFRVYASSVSTTELWASPPYNISVSTGVFRVALEPAIADWQSGSLWLELDIEGNRLTPREELTSSPYAINSLLISGKRYTTAPSAPAAFLPGDLWYDSGAKQVNFWDGVSWVPTSGSGLPGPHAATHAGGGADPIISLGTHTVTGYMSVSSSVSAGWFSGDGAGLYNLEASNIAAGKLSGDRIGNVIVSSHIVDGSIQNQDLAAASVTKDKISTVGCAAGSILQLVGAEWACVAIGGGGPEFDPLSIWRGDLLQATTFYVSSGTVNNFNVNESLKVMGTAMLKGAPGQQGLAVEASGNVGIGMAGAAARLEVRGADTQHYVLAVGTGTAHQVVVSTSGAVGIGTETPRAKMEVSGKDGSGEYIMIFNSGLKMAAWLRNK